MWVAIGNVCLSLFVAIKLDKVRGSVGLVGSGFALVMTLTAGHAVT